MNHGENHANELYHAWLRKGQKAKYIAKVPIGKGKYRYFYDKAEYAAYLKGRRKRTEKQSKTVEKKGNRLFDFVSGMLNEKVTDIKQSAASNRKLIGGFYKKHIVGATKLLFPNRVSNEEIKDHKYIAKVQLADGSYRYFYDQSEYDAYLARKGYQDNEPDFMKDLPEIDGPMSFEEDSLEINEEFYADYMIGKYGLDDFDDGDYYTLNCMLCSSTYELRRRGYDVEAKPMTEELSHQIDLAAIEKYGEDATSLEVNTAYANMIFKDPVIKEVDLSGGGSSYDSLKANVEPNTRGNLMMVWNGGGAHSVAYECDSKGDLTIIDSQIITYLPSTAVMRESTSVNEYFESVSAAYVMRTDNLEFTEQGVDICAREN